jgi:hypothetical protein
MFLHCTHREQRASTGVRQVAEGGGAAEGQANDSSSYLNEGEANMAMQVLHRVVSTNPDLESVALLTPYNGQVRCCVCGGFMLFSWPRQQVWYGVFNARNKAFQQVASLVLHICSLSSHCCRGMVWQLHS